MTSGPPGTSQSHHEHAGHSARSRVAEHPGVCRLVRSGQGHQRQLLSRSGTLVTLEPGLLGPAWRARLVADGGGLENRFRFTPDKGSNPLPSAITCGNAGTTRRLPLIMAGTDTPQTRARRTTDPIPAAHRSALSAETGYAIRAGHARYSRPAPVRRTTSTRARTAATSVAPASATPAAGTPTGASDGVLRSNLAPHLMQQQRSADDGARGTVSRSGPAMRANAASRPAITAPVEGLTMPSAIGPRSASSIAPPSWLHMCWTDKGQPLSNTFDVATTVC